MKTCRTCEEVKPLTEFYRSETSRDGHINQCRKCAVRKVRAYQIGLGEKGQQDHRIYWPEERFPLSGKILK